MCTLGYLLHEIDGTPDIVTSFVLLGGITGTYQHLCMYKILWEALGRTYKTQFLHMLWFVQFIVNCDVIFVHLSDIYVQFLHLHICHILNLLDITSVAIFIHCLIIRTNKFVIISAQSLKYLSPQPHCALT